MKQDSLGESLEKSINLSDLENVAAEFSENLLHSIMSEGIWKEIPIVGAIIGLSKTALSVKDVLFLKKIAFFLKEPAKISQDNRKEAIDKINSSGKYRLKVGEKVLFIVDKCEDTEKSEIVGLFFSAYLSSEITYEQFLRIVSATDRLLVQDLLQFGYSDWKWKDLGEVTDLVSSGLVEINSPEILVRDQDDWKATEKYVVEGTDLIVTVTEVGKLVRSVLKTKRKI